MSDKLTIGNEMKQFDLKNRRFYDELTDEEKKAIKDEIREAVTDPDLSTWYDASGYEADDKCAWHNLYRTTNGGFVVQPEYSNGGGAYPGPGCVVPNQ